MITKEMIDKDLIKKIDEMSYDERNRLLSWSDPSEFSFYYCYYLLGIIENLTNNKED